MWTRIGSAEDFYRYILANYGPPAWVPVVKPPREKERDMAVQLVGAGKAEVERRIAPKTWADLLTFIGERNWRSIEVLS